MCAGLHAVCCSHVQGPPVAPMNIFRFACVLDCMLCRGHALPPCTGDACCSLCLNNRGIKDAAIRRFENKSSAKFSLVEATVPAMP